MVAGVAATTVITKSVKVAKAVSHGAIANRKKRASRGRLKDRVVTRIKSHASRRRRVSRVASVASHARTARIKLRQHQPPRCYQSLQG